MGLTRGQFSPVWFRNEPSRFRQVFFSLVFCWLRLTQLCWCHDEFLVYDVTSISVAFRMETRFVKCISCFSWIQSVNPMCSILSFTIYTCTYHTIDIIMTLLLNIRDNIILISIHTHTYAVQNYGSTEVLIWTARADFVTIAKLTH